MRLLFSIKEKIIIAAIVLVVLLYIVIAWFSFLNPVKAELQTTKQNLQTEQQVLASMSQKNKQTNNTTGQTNTSALQQQLPVEPLQDQFILDLQQAETISNSQISSMTFTSDPVTTTGNQGASGSTSQQSSSNSSGTAAQTSNTTSSSNTQASTSSSSQQQGSAPVNGLMKLTAQLSVQSPSYDEFEQFINTLEGLKRIIVVEAINYTGTNEITSVTQNVQPFTYTLTVSTYYMPGLTDLEKQLPKKDYPLPANKDNPLSTFPIIPAP